MLNEWITVGIDAPDRALVKAIILLPANKKLMNEVYPVREQLVDASRAPSRKETDACFVTDRRKAQSLSFLALPPIMSFTIA